jgi:hypothetical protein
MPTDTVGLGPLLQALRDLVDCVPDWDGPPDDPDLDAEASLPIVPEQTDAELAAFADRIVASRPAIYRRPGAEAVDPPGAHAAYISHLWQTRLGRMIIERDADMQHTLKRMIRADRALLTARPAAISATRRPKTRRIRTQSTAGRAPPAEPRGTETPRTAGETAAADADGYSRRAGSAGSHRSATRAGSLLEDACLAGRRDRAAVQHGCTAGPSWGSSRRPSLPGGQP